MLQQIMNGWRNRSLARTSNIDEVISLDQRLKNSSVKFGQQIVCQDNLAPNIHSRLRRETVVWRRSIQVKKKQEKVNNIQFVL